MSAFRDEKRGFLSALGHMLHSFAKDFSDPYRPERHYMRGPGPKWREKQLKTGSVEEPGASGLVGIRA